MIRIQFVIVCCLLGINNLRAQIVADFSASQVTGCAPLVVTFTDKSTGTPNYWSWGTSNGQISRLQNPSFAFNQPGVYSISLLVKDAAGNFNSVSKVDYITVYPSPAANFTSSNQISCLPAQIQFNSNAQAGQGSITDYLWTFGDGTTSDQPNPLHQYNSEGYYNVSFKVTNSGGCTAQVNLARYIRVIPGVKPDFNWAQTSASCSAPFDIRFVNQTSGPGHISYTWDFGNGAPGSTNVNPNTSYPDNNGYTVKLSAVSDLGCSGTVSKTLSFQGPTPVINMPDSACLNAPVSFSSGGNPTPVSSTWDFGDGNVSTQPNPDNTYTAAGTYTVKLTNNYGSCSSTATKDLKVITNPAVVFNATTPAAGCKAPLNVSFQDQTPGATAWTWYFGDGTAVAHGQTPSHQYTTPGNFYVAESVVTAAGCNVTSNYIFIVQIAPPTATLDMSTLGGCSTIPVKPKANINAPDGVASYSWSAPGATPSTSTSATPSFTYNAPGSYDLTLSFTTNGGCTFTQTYPNAVTIGDRINPQLAATPTSACASLPITFTSTTTPVDKWLWNFGDGDTSSKAPPVIHKYHDTGYFNVSLTVSNNGCKLSYTNPKTVFINGPAAGFSYKTNCSQHVDFYDTSKFDPFKGAVTYQWDFGDGSATSALPNPPHDYPALDAYTITLIVANPECADTITKTIDLRPQTPSFTIKTTDTCRYRPFKIQSTTDSSNISKYIWHIGAATYTTDTTSIRISASDTGNHVITLSVIDGSGCPSLPSAPANILITGPTAKFSAAPTGACRNSPITITDNSTPFRNDRIAAWTVKYGDLNTLAYTTPSPYTHSYTDTGTFDISLIARDIKGCEDTATIRAAVKITSPRAGFLVSDTLYCPNAIMNFTDTSKGSGLTYSWDFGDGGTDATPNPTHTYTANDQYYDVKLKITDATGCADSVVKSKYIHIEKPIASFLLEDSTAMCFPLQAMFTPTGKYYDSLYWDFGDGITSTLDTTSHFYNGYGPANNNYAFVAKLVLQNAGGCRDSAMRNVYVYNPYDVSKLIFTPVQACDSIRAFFTLTPPPYTKYTIYFGDGTADSSGNKNPIHLYDLPSSYSPQMGMIDSTGCIVGFTNASLKVLGATPFFSKSPKAFCDTATVTLHSIYPIPSNDGLTSLTWDFGDGSPPVSSMPTGAPDDPILDQQHYYNKTGLLTLRLTANTVNGCVETYTDTVHVWQTPHPQFTFDGPFCAGPIQFHGSITQPNPDIVTWSWKFTNGSGSATSNDQNPIPILPAGSFTAQLTTSVSFGCNDTTSQPVTINPLPQITGPAVITTPVGIPVSLPFTYSPGITTYTWSPASYLSCTDCANPEATPPFNTTYIVRVVDANNCVSQDTILVKPICSEENYFVPNTFSPNNDGVNDYFYPRGKGLHDVQSMRIFNRWGQLLFERKNFPANTASNGWDGTTNGKPLPADSYIYIIEVICNNAQTVQLHGNVTLIR